MRKHLSRHRFVLKTDIKSYYASINHFLLLEQLAIHIKERFKLNLLWQTMHRISEWGGLFTEHERGIPRGCPLSPLMGTFFLDCLDQAREKLGLFYVRFMDDIVVLSPTRWKLRRAVKTLNETCNSLKLEKHPDKTFIGRIEKGFDFLYIADIFNVLKIRLHELSSLDQLMVDIFSLFKRRYHQKQ